MKRIVDGCKWSSSGFAVLSRFLARNGDVITASCRCIVILGFFLATGVVQAQSTPSISTTASASFCNNYPNCYQLTDIITETGPLPSHASLTLVILPPNGNPVYGGVFGDLTTSSFPITINPTLQLSMPGTYYWAVALNNSSGTILSQEIETALIIPTRFHFPYVGITFDQTLRLTVAGPANVTPGSPVNAVLGFEDANGNTFGPSKAVTFTAPGQTESLDLDFNTLAKGDGFNFNIFGGVAGRGGRVELVPIVKLPTDADGSNAPFQSASAEVFDDVLGIGTVFLRGTSSFPSAPRFARQGLAGGQTMRLTVFNEPPDPCIATLSFADSTGKPVGSPLQVNLTGGQSASLDLKADALSLKFGQNTEVQPMVTLMSVLQNGAPLLGNAAAPEALACPASVEVFDQLTNRTETYQIGSAE